ncbi:junctional adhesion molecule A-like [Bombina bombina]|uniref:junctional adhesion molecule A-like n=1 Tax=Bombina bombina TaxID=8345 RepID=UPI00235AE810|nr:junctional adhesion molecule A-like [Bombina bombina]
MKIILNMEVGNKRLRVLLCLGILYSLGLGVSATGGVTAPNPVIEAKEGEARDLQCTYSNSLTDARVEWKFVNNDQEISFVFYDGTLTAAYKNRATAFHQGIRLNDITRKDNGEYICEVTAKDSTGSLTYGFDKIQLIVLVPPSVPVAQVPTSVTNNKVAQLSCLEMDSSPPATFTWYKNKIPLPENPKSSPAFQNSSYTVDPKTGVLTFETVQKIDAGDYYCEATNSQGKQTSAAVTMSVVAD